MSEPLRPDKRQMRAAFDKAAAHYDEVAVLQREVGDRLLERLDLFRHQPLQILDIGAGTGYCSYGLSQHYPKARIVSLDLAPAMLQHARQRFSRWQRLRRGHAFTCGDAEALPFADARFDLVFSNLTLQWCNDLGATFAEFKRVLKPGGLLLYATLGPDTLKELRASWATVDEGVHVNTFLDMHDVGDAMLQARLADPVMDREDIVMTYREGLTLMRDLKELGAHNVNPGRNNGLTGRATLRRVLDAYGQFRTPDGLLPATYEVVYGHAWRTEHEQQQSHNGETHVALEQWLGSNRNT